MVTKVENRTSRLDSLKWVLVILIIAGGVYANSYYAMESMLYRALAGVVLAAIAVAIALQTEQGRASWELAKEARGEIRKVVWPTREERRTTTGIVVAVVIFVAFILWALDSGLSWLIKGFIG
ncbi:MAG: preprotein translocase subunit SecE [Pseudomonadales bacterium]|jgi:preprotein translocase subunit SecE|nr:preprotein translocase subunit SecE [Pseudomonadales bacterium]HJN52494.1 preprotein translocase subunit SecE [Pseudomonadales bacterium]|tara:strand:+ start:127 stop:495 length:369 start_codon:yes stop_codon:yes gene_type:complete